MTERKSVSLGERWRREATRGIDDKRLAAALDLLPNIRRPMVRIRPGSRNPNCAYCNASVRICWARAAAEGMPEKESQTSSATTTTPRKAIGRYNPAGPTPHDCIAAISLS